MEGADVSVMVPAGAGSWKWPQKEDILYYFKADIIKQIQPPIAKNNRGHFSVPEMSSL